MKYGMVVIFFTFFSGDCWAIGNPIGPGTVPPSSIRSGLVPGPSPIATGGNRIITGNVSGGKHFRGIVPYRSSSDFGAPLGSLPLDSFLRRSAGSGNIGRFSGTFEPYYSRSGTVATTRPGYSGVFPAPMAYDAGRTTMIGGRVTEPDVVETLPSLAKKQTLSGYETSVSVPAARGPSYSRLSPRIKSGVSTTPQEPEKAMPAFGETSLPLLKQGQETPGGLLQGGDLSSQAQIEQFRRDLRQVSEKAAELEESVTGQSDLGWITTETIPLDSPATSTEYLVSSIDKQLDGFGPDVYEQMKQRIDSILEHEVSSSSESVAAGTRRPQLFGEAARDDRQASEESYEEESYELQELEGYEAKDYRPESYQDDELSVVSLSVARAKGIMGSYKSFASFSQDKFNQHLRAAETYLKQGRYYLAADTYTLASIYKPGDPLAYAGKSYALFAAGEYMSSALFLSRALEIFPEYARFKIDIGAMIGDIDGVESRIADIEQWQERSGSAELQFLLGYIYYQTDRLERAKEAIDEAYEKMPEAPAVLALRKAIDAVQPQP